MPSLLHRIVIKLYENGISRKQIIDRLDINESKFMEILMKEYF